MTIASLGKTYYGVYKLFLSSTLLTKRMCQQVQVVCLLEIIDWANNFLGFHHKVKNH